MDFGISYYYFSLNEILRLNFFFLPKLQTMGSIPRNKHISTLRTIQLFLLFIVEIEIAYKKPLELFFLPLFSVFILSSVIYFIYFIRQ